MEEMFIHGRHLTAEKRLLLFLRALYQKRVVGSKTAPTRFDLPMAKGDIASYLGLRPETLSRAFHKLEEKGLVRTKAKSVDLLDSRILLDETERIFSTIN